MDRDEPASDEHAAGQVDWRDSSTLSWIDQPEQVNAAFDRGEGFVGVAVVALALNHSDPAAVLPVIARALESQNQEVRRTPSRSRPAKPADPERQRLGCLFHLPVDLALCHVGAAFPCAVPEPHTRKRTPQR